MLDIQARHRTLAGDDLFTGLVVAPRQRPARVRARGQGQARPPARALPRARRLDGRDPRAHARLAEDLPARDARPALSCAASRGRSREADVVAAFTRVFGQSDAGLHDARPAIDEPGAVEQRFADYLAEIEMARRARRQPADARRDEAGRARACVGCSGSWLLAFSPALRRRGRPGSRCRRRSASCPTSRACIDAATEARLTRRIQELKQKTGAEIAVVTLPTTQPDPVPERAVRLAEAWKPGDRDKDNGVALSRRGRGSRALHRDRLRHRGRAARRARRRDPRSHDRAAVPGRRPRGRHRGRRRPHGRDHRARVRGRAHRRAVARRRRARAPLQHGRPHHPRDHPA